MKNFIDSLRKSVKNRTILFIFLYVLFILMLFPKWSYTDSYTEFIQLYTCQGGTAPLNVPDNFSKVILARACVYRDGSIKVNGVEVFKGTWPAEPEWCYYGECKDPLSDITTIVQAGANTVSYTLECTGCYSAGVIFAIYAETCPDKDGDGYYAVSSTCSNGDDCNDNDATINSGAQDVCDGIDNNCNGQVDEGVLTTYYQDADGDGYGNPAVTTQEACTAPSGYVTNNTDCNDNNPLVYPENGVCCPVPHLTPLTDPLAIRMEGGITLSLMD